MISMAPHLNTLPMIKLQPGIVPDTNTAFLLVFQFQLELNLTEFNEFRWRWRSNIVIVVVDPGLDELGKGRGKQGNSSGG